MADEAFLRALEAIVTEMIRQGVIAPALLDSAVQELEAVGASDAAHQVRCIQLEAGAQRATEWQRDQLRKRMRIVADGGKGPKAS